MQDRQAPELNGGERGVKTENESSPGLESAQDSMNNWMRDICLHLGLGEDDCCVKCGDPSKSLEHKHYHVKCIAKCILCGTQDHPDSMCPQMLEPEFRKVFTDDWFLYRLQLNGFPVAKPKGNPTPPEKGVPTGPNKLPTEPRGSRSKLGGRGGFGGGWSGCEGNTFYSPQPPSIPRPIPGANHAHWRAYREQEKDKNLRREYVEDVEEETLNSIEAQERKAKYARRDWQQALREAGVTERRMHEEEKKLVEMKEKEKKWRAQNVPVGRVNAKVQIKRLRKHEPAGEDERPLDLKDIVKAKARGGEERKEFHSQRAADLEARHKEQLKLKADILALEQQRIAGQREQEKLKADSLALQTQCAAIEVQKRELERARRSSSLPSFSDTVSEPEELDHEMAGDTYGIPMPLFGSRHQRDPSLDSLNGRKT